MSADNRKKQLWRYRMSIFAWQRNKNDEMVRWMSEWGARIRGYTMQSLRSDLAVHTKARTAFELPPTLM